MNEQIISALREQNPDIKVDCIPGSVFTSETAGTPETGLYVSSYPYGSLRCVARFWLDEKKGKTRVMFQTINPKRPGIFWNKPKASTYAIGQTVLYVADNGHVESDNLSMYHVYDGTDDNGQPKFKVDVIDEFERKYCKGFTVLENAYITGLRILIANRTKGN